MTLLEYGEAIYEYGEPSNLVKLFEEGVEKFSSLNLFGEKDSNGVFQWLTYNEIKVEIDKLRGGLHSLGILKKDDAVGIISNNRSEWFICENAVHGLNCRWVPMYEKELFSIWKYIIKDATVKVLFVANKDIYDQVKPFLHEIGTLKKIIIIDNTEDEDLSYHSLLETGNKNPVDAIYPDKDDIAVLIYTSGTTGGPKGVLLSHGNLTVCSAAGYHLYSDVLVKDKFSLAILPWAHSYAISAELHNSIQFGGTIAINNDLDELVEDIAIIKPHVLISVPRVFNKIFSGLTQKMSEKGNFVLKLFNNSVECAIKKAKTGKGGFKYGFFKKTLYKAILNKLGGRMELSLTASAKMEPRIQYFFKGIGLPVYDCYGLTESSPAITMNSPTNFKIGTVGKPVEKTKIVIDQSMVDDKESGEGEIIVFGPQVSIGGYFNKKEQTKRVFFEKDGMRGLRTGDKGKIDDEGYLILTGRFKEEYKLLNGLYIHPDQIEEKIKLLPSVAQCMLYGDGRSYNVALIIPDFALINKEIENIDELKGQDNPKIIVANETFRKVLINQIQTHLEGDLAKYEIPQKYHFLAEEFSVVNKMLTQTMKLKRLNILDKYEKDIDSLY